MPHDIHYLTLEKPSQRALNDKAISNNIQSILAGINNRSLTVSGWQINLDQSHKAAGYESSEYVGTHAAYKYTYRLFLTITYTGEKKPDAHMLPSLCRKLYKNALAPINGKWTLAVVDGDEYEYLDSADDIPIDSVAYADVEIPEDFESYFTHLYGLDNQIGLVKASLEAGLKSNWKHRFHRALIGPPGCGKSALCAALKEALGEEAVLEFDATATTAAGAIKELAEREILPRVMVMEEIEKAEEKANSFLLAVLDQRGEIRKTTARATIQRDTKLLVIATVNNKPLFDKMAFGALSSRFGEPIGFKRPSREQLAMILKREVESIDGDSAWIEPALQYCEEINETDPRKVIGICIAGGDKLLTGEYQEMLRATRWESIDDPADWTNLEAGEEEDDLGEWGA